MKVTYTRVLARKILLAFLALVIILSIAALFVRNSISKKLDHISRLSGNLENGLAIPEHALLLLHQGEDDFQESLVNANSTKNTSYKIKLSQAFKEIDSLLKEETDTSDLSPVQRNRVKYWYQKKLALSDKLYLLKHNFDSLLTAYADFNIQAEKNSDTLNADLRSSKNDVKDNSDTLHRAGHKKGLVRRIKDAIINKDGSSAGIAEIRHNRNSKETDQITRKIAAPNKNTFGNAYSKKLLQLQRQNEKLLGMQRNLTTLNIHIINEMDHIITEIEGINYNMANDFKIMALKSYPESTALLNRLYLTALFLVLVFAILLIVFIIQLNEYELQLRSEIERSVAIAQQKMGLLLHMSHEVRNPLTAINGLLYIFSKSSLSQRQAEMLDSIKQFSEMLLRTLNDTLDAAKMENSALKIDSDPFNPHLTLRAVMESMEFSAAKKGLTLECHFNGDKDAIMIGDGFRLQQIIVNLLSNAIKYTNEGGITVNAQLIEGDNKLQIDVIDTGAGISREQQSKLFSKYYQTNSSKGQIGTGLGLFICKQLVELQKGEITVKSDQGEGSTFSFFIPYQKRENNLIDKSVIYDPLVLLNGATILAVDDNEINLMLLKNMMEKWNVKFLQATNGKQAMDIISKNAIKVILTDIGMPVTAIKEFCKPSPIILMSAATQIGDEEKFLMMGFSGIIGKPFAEAELLEQLVKALK